MLYTQGFTHEVFNSQHAVILQTTSRGSMCTTDLSDHNEFRGIKKNPCFFPFLVNSMPARLGKTNQIMVLNGQL